jgi:hypothetical protein
MSDERWDDTHHRLLAWTNSSAQAETLALQVLHAEGYENLDPSHPFGGPDGGKDALATKAGRPWLMACYFPRGQKSFASIRKKFLDDFVGVEANGVEGMAFVTNQELRLGEREELLAAVGGAAEIFHLDRIAGVLNRPEMRGVRRQFLYLEERDAPRAPARTTSEIRNLGRPTPGGPERWHSVYDGMLLLNVVAVPAPELNRHPDAANPRELLDGVSAVVAGAGRGFPDQVQLLAGRLAEGWSAMQAHLWGSGRLTERVESMTSHPFAGASFDTRTGALTVARTWPTSALDDAQQFSFFAAREPEIAVEFLAAMALTAALLEPVEELEAVDVVVHVAAGADSTGGRLASSERAVSGGLFGEVEGHVENIKLEVPSHHLDSGRFTLDEVRDGFLVASAMLGPWLSLFRADDLIEQLRHRRDAA